MAHQGTAYHPGFRQRHKKTAAVEEAKLFLWNPMTYEVLGMPPTRLLKLVLFYVCFYSCLILFFTVLMAFFLNVIIDSNEPLRRTNTSNILMGMPGMSVRPMPNLDTSLIRFIQGQPSSYKIYTDHIQTFLDLYDNDKQVGENFIDCSKGKSAAQEDKVCRFSMDDLGARCTWQQDYGFDEGTPCILLKFNKVFNWLPEDYPLAERPNIGKSFQYNYIAVTCEGETPVDRENMGDVEFYPSHGFPFYFFPYLNQEGFRAPIVMARFKNAANGVVINVWCKAWARNIFHHRNDMMGSVHFELLMD